MPSQQIDPSVLVAGAGPTGLALALTLAQNGIPVRVVEKDGTFHVGQRGTGIQPRTLETLNYLGVLPDVMQHSAWNHRRCIYEMPEGRRVAKILDMTPFIEPTPDVPFRNVRILGQSHTEEILRAHLAKYNVHVELSTCLQSFTQDADGVTATLVCRGADERDVEESVRIQYLVGAEGAKSAIRKQLGLGFIGETRESTRLIFADIHIEGISTDYWHQWGDMSTKTVMIRPTEYQGVFTVTIGGKEVDIDALMSSHETLLNFIREVSGRRELKFGSFIWLTEFRPNIRVVSKFGEGRVFLVGDSAHVHSPTGGQGLNTGVQDSFNLAWKLNLACKGLASPSLLDSYNAERLPVAKEMIQITTVLLDKTVSFKVTGTDTSFIDRPQALHQIGVNYRWSSIVVDEQHFPDEDAPSSAAYLPEDHTVLRAGDRAPDSPGLRVIFSRDTSGTKVSPTIALFSIYQPTRHTVLLFDSDVENVKPTLDALQRTPDGAFFTVLIRSKDHSGTDDAVFSSLPVDLALLDQEGHAHKYYPPVSVGFTTIIVRPDGVVGAVVRSVAGVEKYLAGVFKV